MPQLFCSMVQVPWPGACRQNRLFVPRLRLHQPEQHGRSPVRPQRVPFAAHILSGHVPGDQTREAQGPQAAPGGSAAFVRASACGQRRSKRRSVHGRAPRGGRADEGLAMSVALGQTARIACLGASVATTPAWAMAPARSGVGLGDRASSPALLDQPECYPG